MFDAAALDSPALFVFRICETAVDVLVHETLIYAVHRATPDSAQLRVSLYCRQHAHCPSGEDASRTVSRQERDELALVNHADVQDLGKI